MFCKFCSKEYIGRSASRNLDKHLIHCNLNPNGIKFKCSKCNKEFESRFSFIGHHKGCGKIKKAYVRKKKHIKTICQYCKIEELNPQKLGAHIPYCKLNPNYEENLNKNRNQNRKDRRHTDETKDKISKSRKKYLLENPDKVPYLLNHSSKESYPEKYFTELFENEGIEVVKKFRIKLYELDFCIADKKIDIEIDGNQHYQDKKIVLSDIKRTKFLNENGWTVIRINWANYKKLDFEERKEYIKQLKNKIDLVSGSGCGPAS